MMAYITRPTTNTPPPNLQRGIDLMQAGQRAEALIYLRRAAQSEPMTADGWLWLASATESRQEYRDCVEQALKLDPEHPTALRMRDSIQIPRPLIVPPTPKRTAVPDGSEDPTLELTLFDEEQTLPRVDDPGRTMKPSQPRVGLNPRLLVRGLMCLSLVALAVLLVWQWQAVREQLGLAEKEASHTIEFTVGSSYRFRVDVPESWIPADRDSPTWRELRDRLVGQFSGGAWEAVESSFSAAAPDPSSGAILPNGARIVETDEGALKRDGVISTLGLVAIVPLPGDELSECGKMRDLKAQFEAGSGYDPVPDGTIIDSTVMTRTGKNNCVFLLDRRYDNLAIFPVDAGQPRTLRVLLLAIPTGDGRAALWMLSMPDSTYRNHQDRVDRIIKSLQSASQG